ncbi:trypsin inhibitor ClTI-1-like [Misgurnus anguillicaudatus]|uniref:trypsin inhibitor ClTI-1-like n=1 Tax=Misgurnus anguillicaudatus TaxID=75329 RepID=UPI003CCFD958
MCNKRSSQPDLKHCQEIDHLRITMARFVLLLLSVAIASASIAVGETTDTIPPNCIQYRLHLGVPCPEKYNPVCGTDGITYKNKYKLCLKRMNSGLNIQTAHMGEC